MLFSLKIPLFWLLLASVYFVFAKLGLIVAFEQVNTSPVWPPTGIAIAAGLYFGPKAFPGILIGAFLTNLHINPGTLLPSLGIAIGNTLEAIVACYFILHFANARPFLRLRDILVFGAAVIIATPVSATIGTGSLFLGDVIQGEQVAPLWLVWWIGDLVGGLVVTPLLLTWVKLPQLGWTARQWSEALIVTVLFAIFALIASGEWIFSNQQPYPINFMFLPFMVWCVVRLQQHGATLFIVLLSCITIYGTLHGHGPFVRSSVTESLILLQGFIATLTIVTLALAASDFERRRATEVALTAQTDMEQRVILRTQDLKEANSALTLELEQKDRTTKALENIMFATSLASDEEFYRITVRNLAETYQSKYAFMGVFTDDSQTAIQTLAMWADGKWEKNVNYDLKGTPCQDALIHKLAFVGTNAPKCYPDDQILIDMKVDSYLGTPLIDQNNQAIGILSVMHDRPMVMHSWSNSVLGLFANRVAAELAHKKAERELMLAAGVFDKSVEAIIIADENAKILRVNPAFTRITGYTTEDVVGKNPSMWKSNIHNKAFYQDLWNVLLTNDFWQGEIINRRKNGENYPTWQTITTVRDENEKPNQFISIFSDITEKKASEEQIYRLAHFDVLTGLPNRTSFHNQLESAIEQARRHGYNLSLLFLDIDNFKLINDTLGHAVGDELLQQFASLLKKVIRQEDSISRLGGDEFTIILSNTRTDEDSAKVSRKILAQLTKPIELQSTEVIVSVSIGISSFPSDGKTVSRLLKNADSAMYRAKERGRNNFQFYTEEMHIHATNRLQMERLMRAGIEKEEFVLQYQPQVNVATGKIIACEALVRWQRPKLGMVPPDDFIPIAEESGLINPLGEWIVEAACQQQKQWLKQGIAPSRIAINLSGKQLFRQGFCKIVEEKIAKVGIDPKYLEFELTESILMEQVKETISVLNNFREIGIHLSIDDFGTGYSSMAYLKRFPINRLKIDRSFIRDLAVDPDDAAIVNATIAMGHSLNLVVIAEGVENKEQLQFLKEHHCNEVQGFYFCCPVFEAEMTRLLQENSPFSALV